MNSELENDPQHVRNNGGDFRPGFVFGVGKFAARHAESITACWNNRRKCELFNHHYPREFSANGRGSPRKKRWSYTNAVHRDAERTGSLSTSKKKKRKGNQPTLLSVISIESPEEPAMEFYIGAPPTTTSGGVCHVNVDIELSSCGKAVAGFKLAAVAVLSWISVVRKRENQNQIDLRRR